MRILIIFALFTLPLTTFADPVVVRTLDAPDTNITGLGYGNGFLWAVDQVTEMVYILNPETGAVLDSWEVLENGTKHPTGLTFMNNTVYVASAEGTLNNAAYCDMYSDTGAYISGFDLDC